jgi:hypothetical protein|tara:strand:+ start:469 stop:741 length:273 start_codon:yes stop_codon:yes gene_type:complete
MPRKIPILSLEDFETKSKKDLVMKSIVDGITEGIELELESISIAEIKHYDIIINASKSEWKPGLEKAMDFYIEKEEYEECSKIRDLINKL